MLQSGVDKKADRMTQVSLSARVEYGQQIYLLAVYTDFRQPGDGWLACFGKRTDCRQTGGCPVGLGFGVQVEVEKSIFGVVFLTSFRSRYETGFRLNTQGFEVVGLLVIVSDEGLWSWQLLKSPDKQQQRVMSEVEAI